MITSAHFVLVHGAGHGAWCWFMVECLLEAAGYKVSSLDLAASGIHPSNPNSIRTFHQYDKPLIDFMTALPKYDKVILVGHSSGGISLVHVMRKFGEKINLAIFVGAIILPLGFATEQDRKDGFPDLSEYGHAFVIKCSQGKNSTPITATFKKEFQPEIFYHLSPKKDSTLASKLLRPWPIGALFKARFKGGEEDAERVRTVFIKTTRDRILKLKQQEAMIREVDAESGSGHRHGPLSLLLGSSKTLRTDTTSLGVVTRIYLQMPP